MPTAGPTTAQIPQRAAKPSSAEKPEFFVVCEPCAPFRRRVFLSDGADAYACAMIMAMKKEAYGTVLATMGLLVLLGACGGGANAGDACTTKGEQTCSGNKEMSCGDDLKWKVDEDCGAEKKTCVVKSGGDADCE